MSTPGVGAQTNLDFCTRPFNIVCRHLSDLTDVGGRPRGDGKGRERGGENWRDFFNFRWTVYFKMWWELCDDERKFFADFKDFFFLILLRGNFFWYYCLGIRLFLIVKLAQKNVQCCSTFDESE